MKELRLHDVHWTSDEEALIRDVGGVVLLGVGYSCIELAPEDVVRLKCWLEEYLREVEDE